MMRIFGSKALIAAILAAAVMASPMAAQARSLKHKHPVPAAGAARPAQAPADPNWGNAALGGNSANSASGSNSAGENAEGRTSGGFGG